MNLPSRDLTPVELRALAAGLRSTPPDPRVSKAVRFAADAAQFLGTPATTKVRPKRSPKDT